MPSTNIAPILILSLGLVLPDGAGATVPDDLCTGDPCVITGVHVVDDFSILDFGSRTVVLDGTLDVGSGAMDLLAGAFTMTPLGRLKAVAAAGAAPAPGGDVVLLIEGDIQLNNRSQIPPPFDFRGLDGGRLELTSTSGSITGEALIDLRSTAVGGLGGELYVDAAASVDLSSAITATSPVMGGFVEVLAGSDVDLGNVNLNGAEVAGELQVWAGGTINLLGPIQARGTSFFDSEGGNVFLRAGLPGDPRDITIASSLSVSATTYGGSVGLEGAHIDIQGAVSAQGSNGFGGIVDANANSLSLTGPIGVEGKSAGGNISISTTDSLVLSGALALDASLTGQAGVLNASSVGELVVNAPISANGGVGGVGGQLNLAGCTVSVAPGTAVEARGDTGAILVQAGNIMTLRGNFSAGPSLGQIVLRYREAAFPPDIAFASFNIPPSLTLDPQVPACVAGPSPIIALHSVTIDANDDVTVIYSKNFDTCAHLKEQNNRITHTQNFFCIVGDQIAVTRPLTDFDFLTRQVKLCHGNDGNICSQLVPIESPNEGVTTTLPPTRGTVTTDGEGDGATVVDPIETSLTSPRGGEVTIVESPATGSPPPGFRLLGWQVAITAPAATPVDPLVLVFSLDPSLLPPGRNENSIDVFRDGVVVPVCVGPPGVASPDPCVSGRTISASGDIEITVLTSAVSTWSFGLSALAELSGRQLQMSDKSGDPSRRRLDLLSTDPLILPPLPGTASDPTLSGAQLVVLNPSTGEQEAVALPASGWTGLGRPAGSAGYRYREAGSGPCRRMLVRSRLMKASCRGAGIGFSLDESQQGSLTVMLEMAGNPFYCMEFGGVIRTDSGTQSSRNGRGRFLATRAAPPTSCPVP